MVRLLFVRGLAAYTDGVGQLGNGLNQMAGQRQTWYLASIN